MRRWLFPSICLLSLLMFVATIGLVIRAEFAVDKVDFGLGDRHAYLGSFKRHVYAEFGKCPEDVSWVRRLYWEVGQPLFPSNDRYWEVRYGTNRFGQSYLAVPHWLLLLISAPLPAWWYVARQRTRSRLRRGLCENCGYDLRASSDRCPECGTPLPAGEGSGVGRVSVSS